MFYVLYVFVTGILYWLFFIFVFMFMSCRCVKVSHRVRCWDGVVCVGCCFAALVSWFLDKRVGVFGM